MSCPFCLFLIPTSVAMLEVLQRQQDVSVKLKIKEDTAAIVFF